MYGSEKVNWLSSDAHSPNWCIIDPADRIIKRIALVY